MAHPDYTDHPRLRRRWQHIINTQGWTCRRCKQQIPPNNPAIWQLGHQADATIGTKSKHNREPEHSKCNTSAGAIAGNKLRAGRVPPSRDW